MLSDDASFRQYVALEPERSSGASAASTLSMPRGARTCTSCPLIADAGLVSHCSPACCAMIASEHQNARIDASHIGGMLYPRVGYQRVGTLFHVWHHGSRVRLKFSQLEIQPMFQQPTLRASRYEQVGWLDVLTNVRLGARQSGNMGVAPARTSCRRERRRERRQLWMPRHARRVEAFFLASPC